MEDLLRAETRASEISPNKPFFVSPPAKGRRITAGFSWLQRIGKSASFDVWFPEALRQALDEILAEGGALKDAHFPAAWAAVRQFELLQEAGNYKIYDLEATHLTRTLVDLTRSMRGGGYRVTVATIGGYEEGARDELEILDRRLQDKLSHLIHMLYLEEQSAAANKANGADLARGQWDYRTALPHVGVTLGARDLFSSKKAGEKRHRLARHFFDTLALLPSDHIVHDTAVGLQLPELIGENEWIYLAQDENTLRSFNRLLGDLFSPFDKISMSGLDGRADAHREVKATVQHMRGYGDRLTPDADQFYRGLAQFGLA